MKIFVDWRRVNPGDNREIKANIVYYRKQGNCRTILQNCFLYNFVKLKVILLLDKRLMKLLEHPKRYRVKVVTEKTSDIIYFSAIFSIIMMNSIASFYINFFTVPHFMSNLESIILFRRLEMLVQSKEIINEVFMQIEKSYRIRTALNVTVKYTVEDVQRGKLWLDILHKIKEDGGSCLIFSSSISVHEMMFNLFSELTGISVEKLLLGMLTPNDWHRLTDIAGYLYEAPFWFSNKFRKIAFDLTDFDLVIEICSFLMTKKEFEDYNALREWYVYR